jgi:hypothetical protein
VGYEAQINTHHHDDPNRTGSLYAGVQGVPVSVRQSPVLGPDWFALEMIVQGNHIIIKVNGLTTADYTDPARLFTSGHIALQQWTHRTVVEFRKIEIKELSLTRTANR